MLRRLTVVLLVLAGVVANIFAQEPTVQNITTQHGLPSNQVYHIYQDHSGYLWFATDRGISRYNGYEFENFRPADGLTDVTVFKFYPQKNGRIWCTTLNNRYFYFHPDSLNFTPYRWADSLSFYATGRVNDDFHIDSAGNVSVTFIQRSGVVKINAQGRHTMQLDPVLRHQVPGQVYLYEERKDDEQFHYLRYIRTPRPLIFPDGELREIPIKGGHTYHKGIRHGEYHIATDKNYIHIQSASGEIRSVLCDYQPIGLGIYDETHFWVGFLYGGIGIYDLQGKQVDYFLPGRSVTFLFRDHEQGLWISTLASGLYRISNPEFRSVIPGEEGYVHDLSVDPEGTVWIATYAGDIYRFRNGKLDLRLPTTGTPAVLVQYDHHRKRVIAYQPPQYHLIYADDRMVSNECRQYSRKISDNREGPIWSAGSDWLLRWDADGPYSHDFGAGLIDAAPTGDRLYVSRFNGIFRVEIGDSSVKEAQIYDLRVDDLDSEGDLMVAATMGAGIRIMRDDSAYHIDMDDGLSSDLVSEVFIENDSIVWACTNNGLNMVKLRRGHAPDITVIREAAGLLSNEVTEVEVFHDTVWVGTRSGLSYFPRSALRHLREKKARRYLRVQEILVNDLPVPEGELRALSHHRNRVEFRFQGISFEQGAGLQYRYRLEGLDDSWKETRSRTATYASLAPGNYTFLLEVSGPTGRFQEQIAIPLYIYPPFYRTLWFALLCVGFAGLVIYLFFRYRILSYNRDITREILRQLMRRLTPGTLNFTIREQGQTIRIDSRTVLYASAADNYVELHTEKGKHVFRGTLKGFLEMVPDKLEYMRINRSYVIRIDKVERKDARSVTIREVEIPIGRTYREAAAQIPI